MARCEKRPVVVTYQLDGASSRGLTGCTCGKTSGQVSIFRRCLAAPAIQIPYINFETQAQPISVRNAAAPHHILYSLLISSRSTYDVMTSYLRHPDTIAAFAVTSQRPHLLLFIAPGRNQVMGTGPAPEGKSAL